MTMVQFNRIGFRVLVDERELAAVRFDQSVIRIGRMASAQLSLDDPGVSRAHCIVETYPSPSIIDLGSQHGTFVNGQKINKRKLEPGDRVAVGPFTLVLATVDELARGTWQPAPIELTVYGIAEPAAPVTDPLAFLQPVAARPAPPEGLPAELAHLEGLAGTAPTAPLVVTPDPARRSQPSPFGDPEERAAFFEMLAQTSAEDRALAEHASVVAVVAIDKLREHRGLDDEAGKAYAALVGGFGLMRMPRVAPSLLIELTYAIPTTDDSMRAVFAATIAHNDATWPYLATLANLPGFARDCAIAAVTAGRDPLPWLAHPFGDVRAAAAQVIRDPAERRRACASVWASFRGSDFEPDFDWSDQLDGTELLELPPIGNLADGLFSPCTDHRAWSIARIADRGDAADALARAREIQPPTRLELGADAIEAILDNERCEALAALAELEELGRAAPK